MTKINVVTDIKKNISVPLGFKFNGLHSGIKKNGKLDLGLFLSVKPCASAGVFTTNLVKSGSVVVCQEHTRKNVAYGIIANSGCANTAVGKKGLADAKLMCSLAASQLGLIDPSSILIASTGVIGKYLPIENIKKGIPSLCALTAGKTSMANAAHAIMTTDTRPKVVSASFNVSGKKVNILAFAKGVGMLHPNMATFLCFILTDCDIKSNLMREALKESVNNTLNLISVDGVTSTNDTVLLLANGLAGNRTIANRSGDYRTFQLALERVCAEIGRKVILDGEGATKLIEIHVKNAKTREDAKKVAEKIATSPLVKTAFFGNDANWGRIITSAGASGVAIKPEKIDVYFNGLLVCKGGEFHPFSEKKALGILKQPEVTLTVDLHLGRENLTYLTCDFSYDYVKINADYRT